MITIDNLVFEYPTKRALHQVSLDIPPNQITALVGPNGAGKSTLMRCIVGLDRPLAGSIVVNGIDAVKHPRQVHAFAGYLSDSFGLYTDLTVMQNLTYAAMSHLHTQSQACLRAEEVMAQLALEQYKETQASELSRGWYQRVGIGMALVHHPKVLLLDEPASGLDPGARAMLATLLKKLQSQGLSLVVSSHILSELEDYCDDMVILEAGKVIEHCCSRDQGELVLELIIDIADNHQAAIEYLTAQAPVVSCELQGSVIRVKHRPDEQWSRQLLVALVQAGFAVTQCQTISTTLQDRYHDAIDQSGGQK